MSCSRPIGGPQTLGGRFREYEKTILTTTKANEAELSIEARRGFVLRVDDNRERRDCSGRLNDTFERIGDETLADPFSREASRACQPSDESGRHVGVSR